MHYPYSLYLITTPLHVSDPFVALHQEVASVCVENFIRFSSKWSFGGPGLKELSILTRLQTAYTFFHTYTYYLLMMGYKWARNM
jgi:hypothetical protein